MKQIRIAVNKSSGNKLLQRRFRQTVYIQSVSAIFDSVELEGTTVSRASVHNISIMEELELGVGDEIEVYKANMIIPQRPYAISSSTSTKPSDGNSLPEIFSENQRTSCSTVSRHKLQGF